MHFRQSVNIDYGGQNFNMDVGQGLKDGEKPKSEENMIRDEARSYILQKA